MFWRSGETVFGRRQVADWLSSWVSTIRTYGRDRRWTPGSRECPTRAILVTGLVFV